jgi:isopropylmalate/homocitrate/citramalate synthase
MKLTINSHTNLLEDDRYKYSLQDVDEPNLYREFFEYSSVPKTSFNFRRNPLGMPKNIWITDTTFRDGQQSREPYTVKQIVDIYKMLSKLSGPKGIIRQTEFFVYSDRDKEAIRQCMDLGLEFPEITTWIRAQKDDFKLVHDIGVKETGILVSCSDYHIFNKLGMTRGQAMNHYLSVISQAFEAGVIPRCHFEDITRADFYGFVVPFIGEITKLSEQAKMPVKIRACDTLGYGIPYVGVSLPRSVPGIIYGLQHYAGVSSEMLEWHGHNDFYKAVSNAATAWLYGASAVNCTLFGVGERTGNVPLEAMVFEYASLKGTLDEMDTTVITDIAKYYENEIGFKIPSQTPFVGENFNVTRAGIHADGLLKDEEIYNIFDTGKLLKRPPKVSVNQNSGLAGIALWINDKYNFEENRKVDKNSELVKYVKGWIDSEYEGGRSSVISSEELEKLINDYFIMK